MAKLMYDAGAISQTEYDDILMKHAALTEALAQEVRLVSHLRVHIFYSLTANVHLVALSAGSDLSLYSSHE